MDQDSQYYRRRGEEERLAAEHALSEEARVAHLELALRYSLLAEGHAAAAGSVPRPGADAADGDARPAIAPLDAVAPSRSA